MMANAMKRQLVDQLKIRGLQHSGRKDRLIARFIRDNAIPQAPKPTDLSTNDQATYDRQAHLDMLFADNVRLCAELNSLRTQLNRATMSEQCETLYNASNYTSISTGDDSNPWAAPFHPCCTTMSSCSVRSPSLNDSTNQDAARPAVPTVSTHEGEPSMAQILAALVNTHTQALLANTLSRGPPTTSLIQIHSTSDTSFSISLFDGTPQQSALE
ncbi:hypothetical protein HPB51_005124 [Rhipicephalus microplus]|uniref:SAP domain-containing protein n=1 Tax=Rhipicephalus microplus TaxID=6941 RepID=A0A9J6EN09_RHIMP|nr:hypothetical protein HPB51_005124 [Rhipicephalus microplus]